MSDQMAPRRCEDCRFWKKDYGTWCVNGWTGMDRDDGYCHVQPVKVYRKGQDIACGKGEKR